MSRYNSSNYAASQRTQTYVNVHEFGVRENDGNDYTVQMQNAIDYAITNGLTLQSNPGTVNISGSGLNIWHSLRWEGPRGKVFSNDPMVLLYNGTGSAITFYRKDSATGPYVDQDTEQLGSVFLYRVNLQRTFSGDSTYSSGYANQAYGFDFYQSGESHFEECAIEGFRVGVHMQGLSIAEYVKCDIQHNYYGVWLKRGAENYDATTNPRARANEKIRFDSCNFYMNFYAHAVAGGYQNSFVNCHMEQSMRTFWFNMDTNNNLIDTFTVSQLNNNAASVGDQYETGNTFDASNASWVEIDFADATSVFQINNFVIEHSRLRFQGAGVVPIKATTLNNPNSQISILLHNLKVMGLGNDGNGKSLGLVSSDSSYQPMLVITGQNVYHDYNDATYPSGSNTYGTGGKIVGFVPNQIYMSSISPLLLPPGGGITTEGTIFYDNTSGHRLQYRTNNFTSQVERITFSDVMPTTGTYQVGDLVVRVTQSPGMNRAWVCTSISPLTFNAIQQIGYRTNAGTPVGVKTPYFIGEELLDTTNNIWYKSVNTTNQDWRALNS